MAAPCTVSELLHSPWQAPPSFFWHSLIERLLLHEPLRVALLCIAPLRLVCADWNAAVGAALPVLAPRPRVPLDELAAAATHLPGLRLLHIESPGTAYARRPDISAEQSAGLAALCAACPSLRSLHLLKWHHLPDGALEALASLTALHTLQVTSNTLHLAAGVLATVAQLPRLRRLGLPCRGLDSTGAAGLAALTGLTSLDLDVAGLAAEADLVPALAQLTVLRHLGLEGPSPAIIAGLTRLTSLSQLGSLTLRGADLSPTAQGVQPMQALLQLMQGLGNSGDSPASGDGSSPGQLGLRQLRLASSQSDPDASASLLPLSALRGLRVLGVTYPALQVAPRAELAHLAGLTDLTLDVLLLEEQHEVEEVGAFVAAVCRRLTGLRRLHLLGAQRLDEVVFEQLAGLSHLTCLSLGQAYDFAGRALAALAPLRCLRRLSLSAVSLNRASLLGVLSEEDGPPCLLPGLTYLALTNCQLLSGPEVAQLVLALPSLRRFLHRSWPPLQSTHLRCMLEESAGLQLLETTWHPAAAPDLPAGRAEPSERQREQQRRHEEDTALCRMFRLRLRHSLLMEPGSISAVPPFEDSPEQAFCEALLL